MKMGCSGSHGTVTILETTNGNAPTAVEAAEDDIKSRISVPAANVRRVSDVPPLESTEPPSEHIDGEDRPADATPATPRGLIPPSMAFDIPLHDNEGSSLVKRHPPKRFRKLEEQQRPGTQSSLTLDELREKQEEAEARRKQFLEARAMSAKTKFAMRYGVEDQGCA